MRRTLGLIARFVVLVALAACVGAFAYADLRDFVIREDYRYYAQAPLRLLYPAGLALGAGALIWLYTSLPRRLRRCVKLVGWGLASTLGVAAAGCLGWLTVRSLQMAGTPIGRLVAENSRSGNLKYITGGLALLVLVVSAESWRRLLGRLRGG
jgi:hypothetical protein